MDIRRLLLVLLITTIIVAGCNDDSQGQYNDPPVTTAYPPGGTYDALVLEVTLTANEPATIYYTTDGSTPDISSPVYSSPIQIWTMTMTTLKFFSIATAGNKESVKKEVYVLTYTPPPDITTDSLPDGVVGASYSRSLTATNGIQPYTWSIIDGSLPPGLGLSGDTVSGTPTTDGSFTFTVEVTGDNHKSDQKQFTVAISPEGVLVITTNSLPGATVGKMYLTGLQAAGGQLPYNWSLADGSLPTGLDIGTNGAISGTPTETGSFDFTVRVTDSASDEATKPLSIRVVSPDTTPLEITTDSLPDGVVGETYSATLTAIGGQSPHNWSLAGGSPPPGLTLSGNTISGTPTTDGSFSFTIRVTDSGSESDQKEFTVAISPEGVLIITTNSLPGATVGKQYLTGLQAAGGQPPYNWSLADGLLPTGLDIGTNGAISGTPTEAGEWSFTVKVTDAASDTDTKELAILTYRPLEFAPYSLPDGMVEVTYSEIMIVVSGGIPPYSWSIDSGELPDGLSLNSNTGEISGVPTTEGQFPFVGRVTDSIGNTGTMNRHITILPISLTITTTTLPDGNVDKFYSAILSAVGGAPPYIWSISSGSLPPDLDLSDATISGTPATEGNYSFTVMVTDSESETDTKALSITVTTGGEDTTPPVAIAEPPGGNYDAPISVTLTATDDVDPNPIIYYTTDGSEPTTSSTVYTAPISIALTTTLKFFARDVAGNEGTVKSEVYIIKDNDTPAITSITPDTGQWGTEVTISGTDFGSNGQVIFTENKEASIVSWDANKIVCTAPIDSVTGAVVVKTTVGTSNSVMFTVTSGDPEWELIDTVTYSGAVLAGREATVEFDNISETIRLVNEGAVLTDKAKEAVRRAPNWVWAALVETLASMSSSDQDNNADKILNASDPYIDEWAFIVAHQVGDDPEVIDDIAQHLLYVKVMNYGASTTDPNYYTTLQYALKDVNTGEAVWIEIPKEIYYMQLVAHSSSNMRSLFFSKNYGDPAIKSSIGKDSAHPAKFVCMSDWNRDDGTNECAFRNAWYNNSVPTSLSPCHRYPQPGVG